jgi:universal stress protein F
MYKHILIPVDLGDVSASRKAVAVARHLARRDGARVSMISVVPAWPEDLASEPRDYQPELDAYIASLSSEGDAPIFGEIKVGGSISGRIIETIENKKIDLVVMASHDPRITDYLIGSNAAHVVLHAPCSVLVVR